MSVINQMLRDLEQRKVKDSISEHYIDEVNIVAKNQFNNWWIVALLITVLSIGLTIHWFPFVDEPVNNEESKVLTLPIELSDIVTKTNTVEETHLPQKNAQLELKEVYKQPSVKTKVYLKTDLEKNTKNSESQKIKQKKNEFDNKIINQKVKVKSKTTDKPENKSINIKENKSKAIPAPVVKVKHKEKSNAMTKVVTRPVGKIKSEVNAKPEIKTKSIKKIPVKKAINKKTSEQVILEARELMANDHKAAIKLLNENINQIQPDVDYYSLLANLQQRQQQYDGAIISYRKAIKMAPYRGELWIGIALAYRGTGEEENALKAFKQALETNNLSPDLRHYATQQIKL